MGSKLLVEEFQAMEAGMCEGTTTKTDVHNGDGRYTHPFLGYLYRVLRLALAGAGKRLLQRGKRRALTRDLPRDEPSAPKHFCERAKSQTGKYGEGRSYKPGRREDFTENSGGRSCTIKKPVTYPYCIPEYHTMSTLL